MTLSSTTTKSSYSGDGATVSFSTGFVFLANAHVTVILRASDGTETTWTEGTQYTLTGAGTGAAGTVTVDASPTDYTPASGTTLVIKRTAPETQGTSLPLGGAFPSSTVEQMIDQLTMLIQAHSEEISRSLVLAETSSFSGLTLPDPSADKVLGWNSGGTDLENKTIVDLGDNVTLSSDTPATAGGSASAGSSTTQVSRSDHKHALDIASQAQAEAGTENTLAMTALRVSQAIAALETDTVNNPNLLINGDFRVAQRGTSFTSASSPANNDDTYLLDRWVNLSDGNDIVDVSQETTTVPTGAYAAIKLDIETANKKAGILQVIEARDAETIIGGTASLSFKARAGGSNATVDKLRAGVISWSSTADSVTSDVVSAWNAEGADPTLATNWTFENTPSDLTLTTSYQTFTIENISIDTASTANVGVFIWIDNDDGTVADLVYITDVKLESSAVATTYRPRPVEAETVLCQRFFWRWAPGATSAAIATGVAFSSTQMNGLIKYPVQMRVAPSLSVSAASQFNVLTTGGNAASAISLSSPTEERTYVIVTSSSLTGGHGAVLESNNTAATLSLDAEL